MKRMKVAAALMVLNALCNVGAFAEKPVRVAAEVMSSDRGRLPTTVMVMDAQGDTLWSRTSTKENFRMRLPGAGRYMIRFDRPGCRSKQVMIDTPARKGSALAFKGRCIRFGVVLEDDPMAELHYAGPVGHIEVGTTGRPVDVAYDYALIRVAR